MDRPAGDGGLRGWPAPRRDRPYFVLHSNICALLTARRRRRISPRSGAARAVTFTSRYPSRTAARRALSMTVAVTYSSGIPDRGLGAVWLLRGSMLGQGTRPRPRGDGGHVPSSPPRHLLGGARWFRQDAVQHAGVAADLQAETRHLGGSQMAGEQGEDQPRFALKNEVRRCRWARPQASRSFLPLSAAGCRREA